ncbi:MAG: hemerythrin domain-containing protein [Hydrogenophaga sp.]|jgi:hemerythrin-like metal-binding protein|uniref:bacteriohemerythrin n=1 Tax=Hydrogenophaga sp. TaxID=1904254 RepID=UPI0027247476|nr:hemerythrin domain-containing protein [Hydrogenophaga sp.]MDO9253041.1 hemerythrin domain-containing protein [Hydrogenophaga sp.]MDP2407345.1 hemerythrin domain-containing protein [Hydrogenophaga sp.]MDP3324777.1 hemerythrin domain-containing protein [Hydrogenophaga sp.]MDZ4177200.1 hemerythrin domain-containing protein [Hydrogenophaga sp.]
MNTTATPEAPATTTGLEWAPSLQTGDARMDETHEEFVVMLNQLLATPQDQQLPLYREFVEHTAAHFAQEERWMLATGFTADNCHASHHATIMETLHAVIPHYQNDDPEIITRLAEALVEWFPQHAASMDAGLALHLKDVGFDSRTETLADPDRVRPATMSGCGSVSCS